MFWLQENLILIIKRSKKCSTTQRFIRTEMTTYRIGTLVALPNTLIFRRSHSPVYYHNAVFWRNAFGQIESFCIYDHFLSKYARVGNLWILGIQRNFVSRHRAYSRKCTSKCVKIKLIKLIHSISANKIALKPRTSLIAPSILYTANPLRIV